MEVFFPPFSVSSFYFTSRPPIFLLAFLLIQNFVQKLVHFLESYSLFFFSFSYFLKNCDLLRAVVLPLAALF